MNAFSSNRLVHSFSQSHIFVFLQWRILYDVTNEYEEFVRHVTEGNIDPFGRHQHGTSMAEGLERVATVIVSHARIAYSAKGQVSVDNVHDVVVDASAA